MSLKECSDIRNAPVTLVYPEGSSSEDGRGTEFENIAIKEQGEEKVDPRTNRLLKSESVRSA